MIKNKVITQNVIFKENRLVLTSFSTRGKIIALKIPY